MSLGTVTLILQVIALAGRLVLLPAGRRILAQSYMRRDRFSDGLKPQCKALTCADSHIRAILYRLSLVSLDQLFSVYVEVLFFNFAD